MESGRSRVGAAAACGLSYLIGDNKQTEPPRYFNAEAEPPRYFNAEAEGWRNNFRALFGNDKYLRSMELVERIKSQEGLEERAAKTKIAKARDLGVIRKTYGDRQAPYELTPENK